MSLRNKITHALIRAEEWIFANPKIVLGMIVTVTLLFATQLPNLRIYTDFADLLPFPFRKMANRYLQFGRQLNSQCPLRDRH